MDIGIPCRRMKPSTRSTPPRRMGWITSCGPSPMDGGLLSSTPASRRTKAPAAASRGRAVLTSDASHYYANMDEGNSFNTFVDLAGVYRAYDRIREVAASADLIVPGHDPLVLQRLKPVADGIVEL